LRDVGIRLDRDIHQLIAEDRMFNFLQP
jgi:hypothetical protein